MRRKIVKKSEYWHRHGNHQGMYGYLISERRREDQERKPRSEAFDSIEELMESTRKRKKKRKKG